MSVNVIVITLFVIALIIIAIMYRNSTLDKLPALAGEETFFEDHGISVSQKGTPRSSLFNKCIVRVTNIRIIIAQKVLFRNQYVLRHVITVSERAGETDLSSTLKKGYVTMNITKGEIKCSPEGGGRGKVEITIPDSALTKGQYIEFMTGKIDLYQKHFG